MKTRLRPWRPADADDCAAACNDAEIRRYLPQLPGPYTRADALEFIQGAGSNQFAVADPDSDKLLGAIGFHEDGKGTAEVGYWVAPWARRRGVATDAVVQVAARGFGRLVLQTHPENGASQRVAIAAGFTREGIARGARRAADGSRYDVIVWSRLADDPPGPSPRPMPDLPGGRIDDGTVRLRALVAGDVDELAGLFGLPEVYLHSVPPQPPPRDRLLRRTLLTDAAWLAGERAAMAIEDVATGGWVGELSLYQLDAPTQQAMIGYSVVPLWRGKGYARRAVRLVAGWAFTSLGLVRLVAGVAPDNVGSRRVLEAAGFVQEGYEKGRLPGPDGTRIDNVQYVRHRE